MAQTSRPALVVVGHASRDLVDEDPRGWRLGGTVSFVSLAAARLGVSTRVVLGTDREGATAPELGLLRDAGADVCVLILPEAPVFRNVETREGRRQECLAAGRPLDPADVPATWQAASAWAFVPILGELRGDAWAGTPRLDALVALGWQGLLREARTGGRTAARAPGADPILVRADVTVASRDDLGGMTMADVASAAGLLAFFPRRGQELIVTAARDGGWLMERSERGWDIVPYRAVAADAEVDLTGAGDVFLAAYMATALDPSLLPPHRPSDRTGARLRFAATAAALSLGGPGITAIPTRAAVQERLAAPEERIERRPG
jgi:sugar/nucleoside kinase (ribokinase family)